MGDKRMIRRGGAVAAAVMAAGLVAAAPAGAQTELQAPGIYVNQGNGTTQTSITVDGNQLTVRIEANGVAAGLVHAQHLHGEPGVVGSCPALGTDDDGDGHLSTAEGVAQYGTVKVSLTTEGDTSPDSALAIDRYPVAEDDGTYVYERSFEVDDTVIENVENWVVIVHGVDLDGSGEYDGDLVSSLNPDLPLEATMPATCGTFTASQVEATPTGGVDAGAGGTAEAPVSRAWALVAGLLGFSILGAGVEAARVRR